MISITPFAASSLRQMVVERIGSFGAHSDAQTVAVNSEVPSGADDPSVSGMSSTDAVSAGKRLGLRITVEKGGCAGMQYTMQLDFERSTDEVNEAEGVCVFVDPQSASYIEGSELDYCDDLVGTGFRLRNPKATRSCGCGTSFEPAESEAAAASEVSGS